MRCTSRVVGALLIVGSASCSEPAGGDSEAETSATGDTSASSDGTTTSEADTTGAGDTSADEGTSTESTGPDGSEAETATLPLPECRQYADAVSSGSLESVEITEASGLAVSRTQPDVLWTHNDSGDSARLFATDITGVDLGQFTLQGATANDWEDLAIGPGPDPGVDYLYVADIGDNAEVRASVTVYRVAEPDVSGGSANLTGVEAICVEYPDGPHDAETLIVDPDTGALLIVTKTMAGASSLFGVEAPAPGGCMMAAPWGELTFGVPPLEGSAMTTAGDISDDGAFIVVRSYNRAFGWRRVPGASLEDAMQGEPCPLPLAIEAQGEALAIAPGGGSYITVSEGDTPTLWRYDAD